MPTLKTIVNAHARNHGYRDEYIHVSHIQEVTHAKLYWIEERVAKIRLRNGPSVYCTQKEWVRFLNEAFPSTDTDSSPNAGNK